MMGSMSTDDTKEFDVTRSPDGDGGADDDSKDSSRWTWVIPVALIGGLVLTYFFVPAFKSFFDGAYDVLSSGDDQRVQEWIDQFGPWGFVAIIGLMLLQTVVAFLPSLVMMVVSVLAYGSVTGGILAWVGLLLAASLGYAIGSSFGPVVVGGLISDDTEEKLRSFVDSYGIWAIVAARISPVLSTDAVSIVAGLAHCHSPYSWPGSAPTSSAFKTDCSSCPA